MKNALRAFILALFSLPLSFSLCSQVKSPAEYLGYEIGSRFTRHHKVVDYVKHLHAECPRTEMIEYGETYEGRPLMVLIVSSADNMGKLEAIRQNNINRVEGQPTDPAFDNTSIIWLSYNVHGNESACMEAALKVMFRACNDEDVLMQKWLQNVVLIIDPCINPDGRDRYANFHNSFGNRIANPDLQSYEHSEPWPGGRTNHYLFDLNRDWAWQTQQESRQRVALYQQWMPHVHSDYHEQGINNPYYFAPAAEPYHKVVSGWQRDFQSEIGKNTARYFDARGEIYFTKESFDLLYPSYGDTYPLYHGAIGMTYEQGGSGRAGLAVETETGDTLTLSQRVTNHVESSISAIEVSARMANKLCNEFVTYHKRNRENPWGSYKGYLIPFKGNEYKMQEFVRFLDKNKIQYSSAQDGKAVLAYNYQNQKEEKVTPSDSDLLISAYQPNSAYLQVLMDPNPVLADSITYDITSWALPYAFGLKAYALKEKLNSGESFPVESAQLPSANDKAYAYVVRMMSMDDYRFLAEMKKQKVGVRVAEEPFTIEGDNYPRGTIIILKKDNQLLGDKLVDIVAESVRKHVSAIRPVTTGMVEKGKDFGSSHYKFIGKSRVAVVGGEGTSSLSFGATWHFFEEDLNYPVTVLEAEYMGRYDLSKYDVLVLPNGWYSSLDSSNTSKITNWVRGGGSLILTGGAIRSLARNGQFSIKRFEDKDEEKKSKEKTKEQDKSDRFDSYALRNRHAIRDRVPGAVYKVKMDNTHPLAFGYGDAYFSLKTSSSRYAFMTDGWNVGYMKSTDKPVSGFSGSRVSEELSNSLVFGVEDKGRGHVIYFVDDPLYRSFWEGGEMLMGNAVFFVGAK